MGESEGFFTGLVFRESMRLEKKKESKGVEGNFKAQKQQIVGKYEALEYKSRELLISTGWERRVDIYTAGWPRS